MKKLLLGLGTLAAVVVPITTIVACGTTSDPGTKGPSTLDNGNQNPGTGSSETQPTTTQGTTDPSVAQTGTPATTQETAGTSETQTGTPATTQGTTDPSVAQTGTPATTQETAGTSETQTSQPDTTHGITGSSKVQQLTDEQKLKEMIKVEYAKLSAIQVEQDTRHIHRTYSGVIYKGYVQPDISTFKTVKEVKDEEWKKWLAAIYAKAFFAAAEKQKLFDYDMILLQLIKIEPKYAHVDGVIEPTVKYPSYQQAQVLNNVGQSTPEVKRKLAAAKQAWEYNDAYEEAVLNLQSTAK